MFEAISVQIFKAKHEDSLFQKLEKHLLSAYFWAKIDFSQFLLRKIILIIPNHF